MKDVQLSVGEVDRTKIIYFTEESDAIDLTAKSDVADARAKGKKKDVISIFSSRTALKNKVRENVIAVPRVSSVPFGCVLGGEAVGEAGGVGHQVDWRQERLHALPGDCQRPPGQVGRAVSVSGRHSYVVQDLKSPVCLYFIHVAVGRAVGPSEVFM